MTSSQSGAAYYDYDIPLGDSFNLTSTELAFALTNDGIVPEPASILLMGLGLGGVALRARKKRG